jgi:hypothetical protein
VGVREREWEWEWEWEWGSGSGEAGEQVRVVGMCFVIWKVGGVCKYGRSFQHWRI